MSDILNWQELTVLIVEDDPSLRSIIVDLFEAKGAKVFEADNGKAGLEVVLNQSIDAVISDICMPEMDGVAMLKAIRERNPDVPIVFLATGFSAVTEDQAVSYGAAAVFEKPFKIGPFFETIEKILLQNRFNKKSA